jgi:biofilm PGA synthesis lipoprotein PgaB
VLVQITLMLVALTGPLLMERLHEKSRQLGVQSMVAGGAPINGIPRSQTGQPAMLVLTYHNVEEHPSSPYSLTPSRFADHMRMLHDVGYTTATTADVEALLAGQPASGHKVLITFDDGAKGIWTHADPVLAHYRMHALAFIVTGLVGTRQPHYVTWAELKAMQRSGRWDFGSRTHLGHRTVAVSPAGGTGPFLASLKWLAKEERSETISEYSARVSDDLAASRAGLTAHGLPDPRFLALPYSRGGVRSDDPRIAPVLTKILHGQFSAVFTNEANARAITRTEINSRLLRRIDVTGQMSATALFWRLHRASPQTVAQSNLRLGSDWCCAAGMSNVTTEDQGQVRLTGPKPTGWRMSTYEPSTIAGWSAYQFSATGHGLSAPHAAVALRVSSDSAAEVRVVMTSTHVRLLRTAGANRTTEIARRSLKPADVHRARVTATSTNTIVQVDGMRIASLGPRSGGIGLGVHLSDKTRKPWFEDVRVAPAES